MISIQNHIKGHGKIPDLLIEESLEKLWFFLNQVDEKGLFKKSSLIMRVRSLKKHVITDQYKNDNQESFSRHFSLMNYLDDEVVLKRIVFSKPEVFKSIKSDINKHVNDSDLFTKTKNSFVKTNFCKLLLSRVFNYESYRSSAALYDIYENMFFDKATCVYCNADSALIISQKDGGLNNKQALFELDHFYPKAKYPYLALSFYNHIPSCSNCNGKLKRSRDFTVETHIHPYVRCFDDEYDFVPNMDVFTGGPLNFVKMRIKNGQTDSLVKDLKLESRYSKLLSVSSANVFIEILHKYEDIIRDGSADPRYEDMLLDLIKSHVSLEQNDVLKRSYSKLKLDLLRAFDINSRIVK